MKKTRIIGFLVALVLGVSMFAACGGSDASEAKSESAPAATESASKETSTASATSEKKEEAEKVEAPEVAEGETLTVGASLASFSNSPFCVYIYEALQEVCERNGWELTAVDAEADPTKQASQIDTLILQEPDIMLVWPKDRSAINPCIQAIYNAGIPCFIINSDLMDEYQQYATAFCGPSQYDLAYAAAEFMMNDLGEGEFNIVIINGMPAETTYVLRTQGFYDAFEQLKEETGCVINVLDDQYANADRNQAQALMENWLAAYGDDIDAILSVSDHVSLGAIAALEAKGKVGDFPIYSIDGMAEYFEYIKSGGATMTVLQAPKYQLYRFEETVKRYLAGETFDYHQYSEFHPVWIENIDEYEPAY